MQAQSNDQMTLFVVEIKLNELEASQLKYANQKDMTPTVRELVQNILSCCVIED